MSGPPAEPGPPAAPAGTVTRRHMIGEWLQRTREQLDGIPETPARAVFLAELDGLVARLAEVPGLDAGPTWRFLADRPLRREPVPPDHPG